MGYAVGSRVELYEDDRVVTVLDLARCDYPTCDDPDLILFFDADKDQNVWTHACEVRGLASD